jgi:hypothetical protein
MHRDDRAHNNGRIVSIDDRCSHVARNGHIAAGGYANLPLHNDPDDLSAINAINAVASVVNAAHRDRRGGS